jgi:outer membrane protein assembly factor BamB
VRVSENPKVSSERLARLIVPAAFALAIGFLGFVAGSYVMLANAFPSGYLSNAYRGGQALLAKSRYDHPYPSELWQPARTSARGVTIYEPDRAQAGYTLYTSGHAQKALLISMAGEILHEWSLPFSQVWDDTADAKDPQPDSHIYYRKAHVYPNGDLLAIYIAAGDTPWGYGLVKMDKDSRLIWKYLRRVHHDLDVAEDGSIYTLTHEIRDDIILGWEHLKPPRIDDFVVVLSPDGEELEKVSVLDALVESPYARMVNRVAWYSAGDFFHTNAVDLLDEQAAKSLSGVSGRQVLLSMRELGAIGLLDLDRQVFTWALRGPWIGQHDPDLLPNGNMLLFDNFGHFGTGGISRVIEFNPHTLEVVWQYAGDDRRPFYSNLRSAQERLGNGNTLITESDGGRLFEVAPDGKIVWEFVNPVRGGDTNELIPVVSWGQRIDPTELDFAFLQSLTH